MYNKHVHSHNYFFNVLQLIFSRQSVINRIGKDIIMAFHDPLCVWKIGI